MWLWGSARSWVWSLQLRRIHSGFSVCLASGEWFVEFWDFIKLRGVRGEGDLDPSTCDCEECVEDCLAFWVEEEEEAW